MRITDLYIRIWALILLAVFYSWYFVKMFRQKQKGIITDQIGKGKTGIVKAIEITMKITTMLVPAVEVISILYGNVSRNAAAAIAGGIIGTVGTALFAVSVIQMKDSWRAGVPVNDQTELVTEGIYSLSRNPAFLGFDLLYIGIVCMFFNAPLLLISAAAALMFHLQIVNVEEDYLMMTFGEEYLTYCRRVHRYFGRKKFNR